ncbi:hypothetical protein SAMN04487843_13826 [Methylobacterium sp. ap11]|uniref:DUF6118 family protein n=1 Tax=Methylobacterium sp. ap11 TaxID=1761799 RepID=UPI0008D12B35|nr:DUF6118 family protein [Methylobacterium sp. ap11]SEP50630.1 hypothetical protein SAMN04487843_13826 [Methylobacterium sp. ap11]
MRDDERRAGQLDPGLGVMEADETVDAAVAFEALRASVERVGREVRAETARLREDVAAALDRAEMAGTPVDYSADLGRLVQELATVGGRLNAIERLPALRQDAERTVTLLQSTSEGLVRDAVQRLDARAAEFLRETRVLKARKWPAWMSEERNWLTSVGLVAGMVGFYIGMMAVLTLPKLLPFGSAERVASQILGSGSWQAGVRLMEFENPVGLSQLSAANELMRVNAAVIEACRQTVAKTGRNHSCSITVPVEGK